MQRVIKTNPVSQSKDNCCNMHKRSCSLSHRCTWAAFTFKYTHKHTFTTHTDSVVRETCTISSIPLGKDCRQQFLFIRLPAIWNQISPEDTMKLQIFSLPVHLPAKAHRINITTLSLSSCYKLARWWHFDQACVSPQSLTRSRTCTHPHTHTHPYPHPHSIRTHTVSRVSTFSVSL